MHAEPHTESENARKRRPVVFLTAMLGRVRRRPFEESFTALGGLVLIALGIKILVEHLTAY